MKGFYYSCVEEYKKLSGEGMSQEAYEIFQNIMLNVTAPFTGSKPPPQLSKHP